jgi:hypothetical protein
MISDKNLRNFKKTKFSPFLKRKDMDEKYEKIKDKPGSMV